MPDLELVDAQPLRLRAPLAHGLDDVVGGRLDVAAVAQAHAEDGLDAVGLRRDDPRRAVRVVDLAADLIALDELADLDHAVGRGDERAVRLTRRH